MSNSTKYIPVSVSMPINWDTKLGELAHKEKKTKSELIREALDKSFNLSNRSKSKRYPHF